MPIQWGLASLSLGLSGIDTRSDPKAVPPSKLARLENATFTTPGAVRKRPGSASLVPLDGDAPRSEDAGALGPDEISDAVGLYTRGDSLTLATQRALYHYDAGRRYWHIDQQDQAFHHRFLPVSITASTVRRSSAADAVDLTLPDRATTASGARTCYVFEGFADNSVGYAIVDNTTGAYERQPVGLQSSAQRPRVVAIGETFLMFCVSAGELACFPITPTSIVADFASLASDVNATTPVYDVVVVGDRALVVYNSDTANTLQFAYVTTAGAVEGSWTSVSTADAPTVVSVAVRASDGRIAISYGMDGNGHVDYAQYNADKTLAVAAATQDSSASDGLMNLTSVWVGSDLHLMYELTAAKTYNRYTRIDGVTLKRHSGLASRAWTDGVRYFVWLTHESPLQTTYFLCCNGAVAGHVLPALAGGCTPRAHLGQVEALSATEWAWAGTIRGGATTFLNRGIVDVRIKIEHRPAVQVASTLYIPSGMLLQHDGETLVEAGFLLYPEVFSAAVSSTATGGLTPGTVRSYKVYAEWSNANGEIERSATASAVEVELGAGNSVQLSINTIAATLKDGAAARHLGFAVFRNIDDAGIIYHRCSSPNPAVSGTNGYPTNDPTNADTISFTDEMSDDDLADEEADIYGLDGGVVDNIAPPPARLVTQGNGRVWLGGFDDPGTLWPSKLRGEGEPVQFSDGLKAACNSSSAPMTALAVLGLSLVVFRETQIAMISGAGPDNSGAGGVFEDPVVVSDEIGCINAASVVRIPLGLMFHSLKGMYLLGRDGALSYIGADVEGALAGETITAAVALTACHEVRFTLASGKTLVYDYLAGQWGTWTVGGLGATLWRGNYVYLADADGTVRQEDATLFTDDGAAYQLALETAWIHIAALQGSQRVRRALFLGEYRGPHRPRVWFAFDYEDAWHGPFDWSPASVLNLAGDAMGGSAFGTGGFGGGTEGAPASSAYQWQVRTPRQRCQAIKIRIEDIPAAGGGVLGDSFRLTDIALEVGVRKSPTRIAPARTAE